MKKILTILTAVCALSLTVNAGTYSSTGGTRVYSGNQGSGPYVALQGGLNLWQDTDDIAFSRTHSNVGGFVGAKAGYAFLTDDFIRPAIEADLFYNGFDQDVRLGGRKIANVGVDSGALLINGLLRFNFGDFEPYFGLGIGGYTASADASLHFRNNGVRYTARDSASETDWAWQIVAGSDYYLNSGTSLFLEGKYLNYMGSLMDSDRTGQFLLGVGVRLHF